MKKQTKTSKTVCKKNKTRKKTIHTIKIGGMDPDPSVALSSLSISNEQDIKKLLDDLDSPNIDVKKEIQTINNILDNIDISDLRNLLNTTRIANKANILLLAAKNDLVMLQKLNKANFSYYEVDLLKSIHHNRDHYHNNIFHYAAMNGKADVLEYIYNNIKLGQQSQLIHSRNKKYETPFHVACNKGDLNTIETLIKLFNDNLAQESRNNNWDNDFIEDYKDDFFNRFNAEKLSPLNSFITYNSYKLSEEDNIKGIKLLVDSGCFIGIVGTRSKSFVFYDENFPSILLVKLSKENVVDEIFSTYYLMFPRGKFMRGVFHYLALKNFYNIIERLLKDEYKLDSGVDDGSIFQYLLFEKDSDSYVPLHYACNHYPYPYRADEDDKLKLVKLIIEQYEKFDKKRGTINDIPSWLNISLNSRYKNTPIMLACKSGYAKIFNYLFQKLNESQKIELFKQDDNHNRTFLHNVCLQNNKEIFHILLPYIKNTIKDIRMIDMRDKEGNQPLHLACLSDVEIHNTTIIKLLIDNGADLYNIDNDMKISPLKYSIKKKSIERVKILLDNINLRDEYNINNHPRSVSIIHFVCEELISEVMNKSYDYEKKLRILIDILSTLLQKDKSLSKVEEDPNDGKRKIVDVYDNIMDVVNFTGIHNQTPLTMIVHASTETDDPIILEELNKVLITLINYGADVNTTQYNNPVLCISLDKFIYPQMITQENPILDTLIKNGADIFGQNRRTLHTPLHEACRNNNLKFVEKFIQIALSNGNINLNIKNNRGETPLHMACYSAHIEIIKILLNNGASVDEKDIDGCTSFFRHCTNFNSIGDRVIIPTESMISNKISIMKLLLDNGADINTQDVIGDTVFQKCIIYINEYRNTAPSLVNFIKIANEIFLTNKKFDINLVNNNSISPLHQLCKNYNNAPLIDIILNLKIADVNITDNQMLTPFHYLCNSGAYTRTIAKKLIDNGANLDSETNYEIMGDYGEMVRIRKKPLEYLLEVPGGGIDVFTRETEFLDNYIKKSAMEKYRRDTGMMNKFFMKGGAKGYSDYEKHSELVQILQSEDLDKLKKEANQIKILSKGEESIRDIDLTLLSIACKNRNKKSNKNMDIIKYLIEEENYDVNEETIERTPLYNIFNKYSYREDIVLYLIEKGAIINPVTETNAPIFSAVVSENIDGLNFLLNKRVNINVKDNHRYTPLHYSVFGTNPSLTKLIENGANIDGDDETTRTPLQIACKEGFIDSVKILIDKGANINLSNVDSPPIHLALINKHKDIASLLINNGVNLQSRDNYENSVLHNTCENSIDLIDDVIYKISPNEIFDTLTHKNIYGKTPLHVVCTSISKYEVNLIITQFMSSLYSNPLYSNNQDELNLMLIRFLNDEDEYGNTPLHISITNNLGLEITEYLLDNDNINVNVENRFGQTPLHLACQTARESTTKLLIEKGADIYTTNLNGNNALHLACAVQTDFLIADQLEKNLCVKTLIELGPNLYKLLFDKNIHGETPLDVALYYGNKELSKLLIQCYSLSAYEINDVSLKIKVFEEGRKKNWISHLVNIKVKQSEGLGFDINKMSYSEQEQFFIDIEDIEHEHNHILEEAEKKVSRDTHELYSIYKYLPNKTNESLRNRELGKPFNII